MSWLTTITEMISNEAEQLELETMRQKGFCYTDGKATLYYFFLPENIFWQWMDKPTADWITEPTRFLGIKSPYLVIHRVEGDVQRMTKKRLQKFLKYIRDKYKVEPEYIVYYRVKHDRVVVMPVKTEVM